MYLYLIKEISRKGPIKIGVARNTKKRLETLQIGNPNKLELVMAFKADSRAQAYELERWAHRVFKHQHIRGEWFSSKIQLSRLEGKLKKLFITGD